MRIIHLITGLNVGGAETMLARLLAEHRRSQPVLQSSVLSLMPPGHAGERIRGLGVPLDHLGLAGLGSLPGAAARLVGRIRAARPDLIVAWMYHSHLASLVARAAVRPSVPIVWNVRHSLHDLRHERPATRAILRSAALLSWVPQAIVYNSWKAAGQYEALGYSFERRVVVPNGFDLDLFRPDPAARTRLGAQLGVGSDTLIVGLAARNHPMKDPATLVRAIAQPLAAGIDLHLLVTGAGMTQPTADFAQALAALPSGRVTLRDHEPNMAGLLPGLDVLALSSAWGEGFPNILGEAMACGVPCIATDVGDSSRVVGETGVIVPPGQPEAFAAGLQRIAAMTPAQRRALGLAGRRRIEQHFSISRVAARYAELFDSIAGDRPKAVPAAPAPAPLAAE